MIELKPCPFCGGEARAGEYNGGFGYVGCAGGACRMSPHAFGFPSVEDAAEAWNRRAALSEADFAAAVHDGGLWRKERACRMDGPDPVYWRCTSCGAFVRRDAVADCYRVIPATWCPNCGARIERGDEG